MTKQLGNHVLAVTAQRWKFVPFVKATVWFSFYEDKTWAEIYNLIEDLKEQGAIVRLFDRNELKDLGIEMVT